jgi:Protein of unknown function (DUF1153)
MAKRGAETLPLPGTRYWTARRKALLVETVRGGRLTLAEAWSSYGVSGEEFASWEERLDRHGVGGLRVARLKQFR